MFLFFRVLKQFVVIEFLGMLEVEFFGCLVAWGPCRLRLFCAGYLKPRRRAGLVWGSAKRHKKCGANSCGARTGP